MFCTLIYFLQVVFLLTVFFIKGSNKIISIKQNLFYNCSQTLQCGFCGFTNYICGLGITLVGWGLHLWAGITLVGWGLHLWAGDYTSGLGITLVGWGLHLWAGDYTSGLGITLVGWGLH